MILVDRYTRVVVQGITGREGAFHAARCREYGTTVVGGVTPGKGGTHPRGLHRVEHGGRGGRQGGGRLRPHLRPAGGRRRRHHGGGGGRRVPRSCASPRASRWRTWSAPSSFCRGRRAGSSGRTVRASSPRGRPRSASCPGTFTGRDRSASCRAAAPSPTRWWASSPGADSASRPASGIGGDPVNGTTFVEVLRPLQRGPRDAGHHDDRRDRGQRRGGGRRLHRGPRHESRWWPSSAARRPRPVAGWDTPGPSSPGARARPPKR